MRLWQTFIWIFISLAAAGQRQDVSFEVSATSIPVGETLKWKVIIKGHEEFQVSELPVIPGFKKEGRLVAHSMVTVAGKRQIQHTITQNYRALEAGTFKSPETELQVNGTEVDLPVIEITVLSQETPAEEEFKANSNSDALLFLFVDKKNVYVGEPIHIHLAFYVSEQNTAAWQFPRNLNGQVAAISVGIKPKNCLENRKNITEIVPEPAQIGDKKYIRYKIYEAYFYPLTEDDISIKAQAISMEKRGEGNDSTSVINQSFLSRPYSILVKPLPEHPLKNKVAVGNYQLSEPAQFSILQTGKIINYPILIHGEGNSGSLNFDTPVSDGSLDFYPPLVSGEQAPGTVSGSRRFTFKIFPKDSGTFDMGNYFRWIYFNPASGNYDTLKARGILRTQGPRVESSLASSGDIYAGIDQKLITEKSINYRKIIKNVANVLLILMLASMLFIFDFKRQKPQ